MGSGSEGRFRRCSAPQKGCTAHRLHTFLSHEKKAKKREKSKEGAGVQSPARPPFFRFVRLFPFSMIVRLTKIDKPLLQHSTFCYIALHQQAARVVQPALFLPPLLHFLHSFLNQFLAFRAMQVSKLPLCRTFI